MNGPSNEPDAPTPPTTPRRDELRRPDRADPRLRRASDIVARTVVLVAAAALVAMVLWQLKIVVLPVFVALLVCTALTPPVVFLERRGWRPLLATWTVFVLFFVLILVVGRLIVPSTASELRNIGPALSSGVGDIEDWAVDGPLGLDREQVQQYTEDPVGRANEVFETSSDSLMSGVRTAGEVAVGIVLSIVLTFLFLKDGRKFQAAVMRAVPDRRRVLTSAIGAQVWGSFGGFLRGATILGAVEGLIIGTTMAIVGAPLAVPVGVLTFVGAFFPIVGAVAAGALATLVTLATGGPGEALVVLAVVILVQQLDNDLLAPFIYGRSLELHPVAVLLALTAGGALGGIVGAFIAVPVVSAGWGVGVELWKHRQDLDPPDPSSTLVVGSVNDTGAALSTDGPGGLMNPDQ